MILDKRLVWSRIGVGMRSFRRGCMLVSLLCVIVGFVDGIEGVLMREVLGRRLGVRLRGNGGCRYLLGVCYGVGYAMSWGCVGFGYLLYFGFF